MKPRRFPSANAVFSLQGGNEDNDLWVEKSAFSDGTPFIRSLWEFTDEERKLIAEGHNISLTIIGSGVPPLQMQTTPEKPGKGDG